jgi:ceramide glucosyltransferase
VTFSLAWAMLLVLALPARWWSWTLLVAALVARLAVALRIGLRTLSDRQVAKNLWLLPLRDLLAMAIWFSSYLSNTVTWGGERFRLKDGRMYPLSDGPGSAPVKSNQKVRSQIQR